ncbi:MAG: hypothetical protein HY899_01315 [Deltaproteobacteria bacterium]|nr:hypothetical protein [Deltaproteobacteria bacterium]
MSSRKAFAVSLLGAALALATLAGLGVRGYGGNVSALLHVYRPFGEQFAMPPGTVLYEDGGYDGMHYYQVARSLPALVGAHATGEVPLFDETYRYQRILLPAAAFVAAAGSEERLPAAILLINVVAIVATMALFIRATGAVSVHAFALVANPAALIGVLYSLSEPLALLCTTAFLATVLRGKGTLTPAGALLLALALLARETTLLVTLPLAALFVCRCQWRDAALALASLIPAALWQGFLLLRFGSLALERSARTLALPLSGPAALVLDTLREPTLYGLSALAFLLLIALPIALIAIERCFREWRSPSVTTVLLASLTLSLFCLHPEIWSVITAVGRVVPALYPVFAFAAAQSDTPRDRAASAAMIVVSGVAAVGVALVRHPFTLS